MNFDIKTSSYFEAEIKRLAKRHRSLVSDLKAFMNSLKENPLQGIELAPGIRKVQMAIKSKGKGKAGGARIITFNVLVSKEEGTIFLLLIYDKADASSIKVSVIKEIIKEMGL